jgi:hypothetical protein
MDNQRHQDEASWQPLAALRSIALPDGLYLIPADVSDPSVAQATERQNQILVLIVSLLIILAVLWAFSGARVP